MKSCKSTYLLLLIITCFFHLQVAADEETSILPSTVNEFEVGDPDAGLMFERMFNLRQECDERIMFREKCDDYPEHTKDACTFKGKGKACLGIEYTCGPGCGGNHSSSGNSKTNENELDFELLEEGKSSCQSGASYSTTKVVRKWCCDFGEEGDEPCGCNKEIQSPGACDTPEKCLECMLLAEVGHHLDDPEDRTCAACVKKSMDERIAKNRKVDNYCQLNSTYYGTWAYSPFDCVCNSKDPEGGTRHSLETKYCRCCTGEGLSRAENELLEYTKGVDTSDCPVNDIDGYTSDGVPQYKIDPRTGKRVLCKKVKARGCEAFDFWDCY